MFKPMLKPIFSTGFAMSFVTLLAFTGPAATAQTLEKVPEEPVEARSPLPAAKGSLVIIGGGPAGTQAATVAARLGAEVMVCPVAVPPAFPRLP